MPDTADLRAHAVSRRAILAVAAAGLVDLATHGRAATAAGSVPACVVRPEQTEGPFFVEERLNRSDIRTDPATGAESPGTPLSLTFKTSSVAAGRCAPLAGATIDIWHCDASGAYSDVRDPRHPTAGRKFLRGFQTTDASGVARFTTIYPGWYMGRAVHIHFKVRTDPAARGREFTSQLYFDDALTDAVHRRPPYAVHGARRTRNEDDVLFLHGGRSLLLKVTDTGSAYAATFDLGVDLS